MKKLFLFLLCFLINITANADERILSYDVLLDVQMDGSVIVTEDITVRHEGNQIKRGLYRDLPTNNKEIYSLLGVKRNGLFEPSFVEHPRGFYRINTGNDNFLPRNTVSTFQITYQVLNALKKYNGFDELYWNVTGNDWAFPIDKVSARVLLPDGVSVIQQASYQGVRGSKESANESGKGGFYAHSLGRGQGLTVAVGFTPNVIDIKKPSLSQNIRFFLTENKNMFLYLGILFLYFVVVWYFFGRDPQGHAIMPRFLVPHHTTACEACILMNDGYINKRLMLTHFVSMLQNKAITITQTKEKEFLLPAHYRVNTLPKKKKTEEEKLYAKAYPNKQYLYAKYSEKFKNYSKEFADFVKQKMDKQIYHKNFWFLLIGVALSVFLALFFFTKDLLFFMFILSCLFFRFGYIGAVAFLALLIFYRTVPLNLFLYLMTSLTMIFVFKHLLFRPSVIGKQRIEELEGIKMFIKATHTDSPVNLSVEQMEALFPYAVAMGVEKEWRKKFEPILAAMEKEPAPIYTSSAFSRSFCSCIASTACSPASSGGIGGGGSGGGGGCGGGSGGGGGGGR